jgi:hypothetical protein
VSIQDIREGIVSNLSSISGLRTSVDIPDNPSPPIAFVGLESVQYDQSFQRGLTEYNFTVTVLVGRVSERSAQRKLDEYISNDARSIKLAIEEDKTLGGASYDVRVSELRNVGTVSLEQVIYLAADFAVTVFAD